MVSTFEDSLKQAEDPRLQAALRTVYAGLWPDRIVVNVHWMSDVEFQRSRGDVKVTLRATHGAEWDVSICETVEEKIRQWPNSAYSDLLVETVSNREFGTAGWIYTSNAQWLSYVRRFNNGVLLIWLLPMQELRMWFTAHGDRFLPDIPTKRNATQLSNGQLYHTLNRSIPRHDPLFAAFWNAHGCREIRTVMGGI